MPGTLRALRELGVAIRPGDGQVFRGMRFVDSASAVEANFLGTSGLGMRRITLHQRVVERAEEGGVTRLWNAAVTGLSSEGASLGEKIMKAKWIVGADGIHSRVRRWIGLDSSARLEKRFAQRRHFRVKPWTDCMEVHWSNRAHAYVTPLGNDETCAALISRDPRMRLMDAWPEFPVLASYMRHVEPSSEERGAVTVSRRLRHVYRGNVALTGDASGSVDAITGEGLCLSFRHALALADALSKGKLLSYQRVHRQLATRPHVLGRLLLLLDLYPALRKRAVRILAEDPGLFARLLSAHVVDTSASFLAATSMRLGWQFLTA